MADSGAKKQPNQQDQKKEEEKNQKNDPEPKDQENKDQGGNNPNDNTTTATQSEAGDGKKKQYFKEELGRLRKSLEREATKIKKPPVKEHTPFIFNTLEPYYNVHTAEYLIDLPDEVRHDHGTRSTAVGLCDPWIDHRMDTEVLPKIKTQAMVTQPLDSADKSEAEGPTQENSPRQKNDKKGKRPPREGSTRLPKFPQVSVPARDLGMRTLDYSHVPALREELRKKYSSNASLKVNNEYKRTKQDFYRMELDRVEDYHPISRPHMRATYFAYLQNNPGSRKAIYECMKNKSKEQPEQRRQSRASSQQQQQPQAAKA